MKQIGYAFEVTYIHDGDKSQFCIITSDVRMDKVGELAEQELIILCGQDADCYINSMRYIGQAFSRLQDKDKDAL